MAFQADRPPWVRGTALSRIICVRLPARSAGWAEAGCNSYPVPGGLSGSGITFALGAPGAGARPAAAPPGHGKAPAAVNGDNGTVKIHNSSTPVTDRRNEPHVCVFYLDAFGFDPGQSVSWQIKSWPPTGDRAVVDQGTLTLDSAGDGRTSDQALPNGHYKLFWTFTGEHGAAKQKVFWVSCPSSTPTPTPTSPSPTPTPTCTCATPAPTSTSSSPAPGYIVLAGPSAEPDVLHRARSGTCAGAEHPARDGLRHWALTTGGSRATGSFASAGSRASCAARPAMGVALEPPGSPGPAACGGRRPAG